MSQQLHCVELVTLLALTRQPPAFTKKLLTLDEAWLVMPLPDVDEAIVPVDKMPCMIVEAVTLTVDEPPWIGSGQVSPTVVVVEVPLVVMTALIPVARPLNS